jgi:hypothetical protein
MRSNSPCSSRARIRAGISGSPRWLLRLLEEDPHATIEEAMLAAASLVALTGVAHGEAAQTLRATAERATSRRRARDVGA